ncbi:GTP-binding protein [Phosphitispora fastidiosa]|uniref:GTP-binding protein n=1 Tax=Phosphitispora fastidiosa TaxID=2837202 RepID=UPI001E44A85A|nr:GTP-binding protein [Phosphitispora fastidiosa]MBU7006531.1 G3E family GTPase [Phosphitispora fastidiosa]
MDILLFGGFLGSGKTSVILQLAKYLIETRNETVAIIENEIGQTGIDDQVIAQQGLKVKGVFAGCVCCQITGELVAAIDEIHTTVNPDWLIIETTGLAVPRKIVTLLQNQCRSFEALKTIVLTDVSRWTAIMEVVEPLVVSQIEAADVIIINKVDLASEDTIRALKNDLEQINQNAAIFELNADNGIDEVKLRGLVQL